MKLIVLKLTFENCNVQLRKLCGVKMMSSSFIYNNLENFTFTVNDRPTPHNRTPNTKELSDEPPMSWIDFVIAKHNDCALLLTSTIGFWQLRKSNDLVKYHFIISTFIAHKCKNISICNFYRFAEWDVNNVRSNQLQWHIQLIDECEHIAKNELHNIWVRFPSTYINHKTDL